MANPAGESDGGALRLDFDRRLTLQFRGSVVTSDAGLLAYRELDDALGLSAMTGEMLGDVHADQALSDRQHVGRLALDRRLLCETSFKLVSRIDLIEGRAEMVWVNGDGPAEAAGAP